MNHLCLVLDSSLQSWERDYFHALGLRLGAEVHFRRESPRNSKLNARSRMWFVSRHWRDWAHYYAAPGIYFSPLGPYTGNISFYQHLRGKFVGEPHAHVLTHSSLTQRFFTQVDNRAGALVSRLELPYLPLPSCLIRGAESTRGTLKVGVLSDFDSESNLSALSSIAHFIRGKSPEIRFLVRGRGKLVPHFLTQLVELGLQATVSMHNEQGPMPCDVLLHLPLRSEHFIPVFEAATAGLPVLTYETADIGKWVRHAHSGFFAPVHETGAAADLLLRLSDDLALRKLLGQKLQSQCLIQQLEETQLAQFQMFFSADSRMEKAA
jgi:hypothetical protein